MLDQPLFATVKARLSDVPGIDAMSVSNIAGRISFGMNGKIAAVDENASDDEIDAAIRATFGGHVTPAPAAIPLAAPSTAVVPAKETAPVSITGAAPATLSIKAMIEASRQKVKGAHEKLIANAAKVSQAADALDGLGDDLGTEADDLLAMVGQYKNDLG